MSEWTPANPVEQTLAAALASSDGVRYGSVLRDAALYLPELAEPGSLAEHALAQLLPPGLPFVPVYTSAQSLTWALGPHAGGWQQLTLSALRRRWPDPQHQLAVNAGTPIAVFVPPGQVDDLAEGRQSLVPVAPAAQAVADQAADRVRRACLAALGQPDPPATPQPHPAVDDFEDALQAAVAAQDSDALLVALVGAELVLPAPASESAAESAGRPGLVIGDEGLAAVVCFSSPELLAQTAPGIADWARVSFLELAIEWPDEQVALCLNPGSVTELIVPGAAILELARMLAEAALAESG